MAIGNWNQVKSDLRRKWGQLTDEELEQTHGDLSELEGLMQSKYGYQREEARKHLQNFMRPYGSEREANPQSFAGGSEGGGNDEQVTGGGETSTDDPASPRNGSVGSESGK